MAATNSVIRSRRLRCCCMTDVEVSPAPFSYLNPTLGNYVYVFLRACVRVSFDVNGWDGTRLRESRGAGVFRGRPDVFVYEFE